MTQSVGPQLTMLPIFTWKIANFNKNNIDLMALLDLCVFDSNKNQIISST